MVEFALGFKKGYVFSTLGTSYKTGDNYAYSYIPQASNEKLLLSYGFYLDKNISSKAAVPIHFFKPFINREKYPLIQKLQLLEFSLDPFFNSNQNAMSLNMYLSPYKANDKILNLIRIYNIHQNDYNAQLVEERTLKGLWLSYENELTSHLILKKGINDALAKSPLTYDDIIQSLEITRNYFKKNREQVTSNPIMQFRYRLRRRIMEVQRENKNILHKNIIYTNEGINNVVTDNIWKLRDYYLNN